MGIIKPNNFCPSGQAFFLVIWLFPFFSSHVRAQVPVFAEPQDFKFENYTQGTIKMNTGSDVKNNYSIPTFTPGNNSYVLNPQVQNPSASMAQLHNIPPVGASSEQLRRYADEDIRRHQVEQKQKQDQLKEATAAIDEMHIDYEFSFSEKPEKWEFGLAFEELKKMLDGQTPLNLERAVFLTEHAYDPSLKFSDFDGYLNKSAAIIGLKMQQDKILASDNLGKIMTTFKFMADTITVTSKQESTITTYPKTYDFEDFWGRQDYRKMFVSKLLKEGNGQCHSLPLLFLLLCEKIGADANLAFAPNHSFIKFKDTRGKWHNIELTNGIFATDHFIIESGYVKAEAMQNKIFMEPLTKKQVVVQCLNDLALGYQKKFGYDPFVKACSELALSHEPKSLTARQTISNYYVNLGNYIIHQYKVKGFSKSQLDQDKNAQAIFTSANEAIEYIDNLGYSDMPEEAYKAWLSSIQKEAFRQQHSNEIKVLGGMIEKK